MGLHSLLRDFNKFERIKKYPGQKIIDLSNFRFIAPATLMPAYHYAISNSIPEYMPHENTSEHLDKIFGRSKCNDNLMPLLAIKLNLDKRTKIKILSSIDKKIRKMLFPGNDEEYREYGEVNQ